MSFRSQADHWKKNIRSVPRRFSLKSDVWYPAAVPSENILCLKIDSVLSTAKTDTILPETDFQYHQNSPCPLFAKPHTTDSNLPLLHDRDLSTASGDSDCWYKYKTESVYQVRTDNIDFELIVFVSLPQKLLHFSAQCWWSDFLWSATNQILCLNVESEKNKTVEVLIHPAYEVPAAPPVRAYFPVPTLSFSACVLCRITAAPVSVNVRYSVFWLMHK